MKHYLLFFLILPILVVGQNQIGQDIDGETLKDNFGQSISLSSDGRIIAIGASQNSDNGEASGHVRVYENQSGIWTQIGEDIDGEAELNFSGNSISLSSDGSIVAIGAYFNSGNGVGAGHVRIYENKAGTWMQIGNDIDGESAGDNSGWSVSLSSDGSIVAIAAPGNDANSTQSGNVRIYQNLLGTWTQIGNDIDDGEYAFENSGMSVSLSEDGNVVAIGSPKYPGNGLLQSGQVSIYENKSGIWTQIGNPIKGEAADDNSGWSVSLSSDGSIIAIGAPNNNGTDISAGHVRVYENISGIWTKIGNDIDGEARNDNSGCSVSLSSDGSIVAIGAYYNDGSDIAVGQVRVFKNHSNTWIQIGNDIDGEARNDNSGWSVSLSSEGSIVAIGAPLNDGVNGEDSGHVRIYDLTAVLYTENFKKNYFSFYPNPINDELNKGLELTKINIYKIQGQYLFSTKASKIDVSNLTSGLYFIEVETNQGKSAKKVVIE